MSERKEKFTPGPWSVCRDDANVVAPHPTPALFSAFARGDWIDCNTPHNAHLIAAAPELYEALKHLYEQIGGLCERGKITESDLAGGFDEDLEEAVAALAKARGEA